MGHLNGLRDLDPDVQRPTLLRTLLPYLIVFLLGTSVSMVGSYFSGQIANAQEIQQLRDRPTFDPIALKSLEDRVGALEHQVSTLESQMDSQSNKLDTLLARSDPKGQP